MKLVTLLATAFVAASLTGTCVAAEKPNVLLILADDLGFSDLGCYGGEIQTPHLDALANEGLRFTRFYNSARCSPSRVGILTGREPHAAGFPLIDGQFTAGSLLIPEAVAPTGYQSYMVGKWHLGRKFKPTDRGFGEFYGMLGGYNTCWEEDPHYTRWPQGRTKRSYAPGAFYATDVFADYTLDFIHDAHAKNKPWFLYLAFNAPHFPLHAYEQDIQRYESLYMQGWDTLRQRRFERMKQLGLLPESAELSERAMIPLNKFNDQTGWANKQNPAWDSLPEDRRRDLARRMAVYAAMVDRLDAAVGKVVNELRAADQLDNTLILFLSDNGACAEWDPYGFDKNSGPNNVLHTGDDLKNVGGPASYVSYGSGWANLSNTPFSLYKHYATEGGTRSPLIVHWPAGLKTKPGQIVNDPGHITDLLPTILAVTGSELPATNPLGETLEPLAGMNLLPVLQGQTLPERTLCIEHEGNRSASRGQWKINALNGKPWALYSILTDPGETKDVSGDHPDVVKELSAEWDAWAKRNRVPPPPKVRL